MPRASYLAIGLVLLLGLLNFMPLPWNNNWLRGEGAPAFAWTIRTRRHYSEHSNSSSRPRSYRRPIWLKSSLRLSVPFRTAVCPRTSSARACPNFSKVLRNADLDAGRITDGLERIAKALDPSAFTKPVATEIFKLDLNKAADEVRNIDKNLNAAPDSKLREMAERFQEASDVAGQGLEQLSQYLGNTASAMQRRDNTAGQQGLRQVAQELERLQRVLESPAPSQRSQFRSRIVGRIRRRDTWRNRRRRVESGTG